ncbi:MAG: ribose-phosphate diphosphokinase [Verrucomicrobiaceae bacterium]|nr:ribose-phosphate diphosphokinase [Verrucomicrobiaceae bacterium]
MLQLLAGSAHLDLAQEIAQHLNTRLCEAQVTTFPDGETFVKIEENIRGNDLFLIQPTCPPTNHHLMELLIMVDAVKRASAARITAVIPFFGYARQDRKDESRVPITAKLVANLITAAGVDRVLTMDLHAGQIQGFFDIPVDHLYAAPVLINHIRSMNLGDLVVVSPDVGGIKMTHAYAKALDSDMAIVAKERLSATEVAAHSIIGDVNGRHVLLVDDMTETAGTLVAAAGLLIERGASSVRAIVSHAVLNELAHKRLAESLIEELICTNSTPMAAGDKVTALSVAPLLAEAINRISQGKSVSSLFQT